MCAMTLTKKSAEREYDKKLYSIALRYVRNHHDAEEIVQDTFLKIYKVIEKVHNLPRGSCKIYCVNSKSMVQ